MPRGIPNAKRDDTGMRYTTFTVPLAPNPKQMGTTYLKSDAQSLWARNALRKRDASAEDAGAPSQDHRRGSHVIVIHPGSRWLRVGRASDVNPVSVPHVVARKCKPPTPVPAFVEGVSRPKRGKRKPVSPSQSQNGDEYDVSPVSDDPFETKIAAITVSLRDRMRFYKLRVTSNANQIASTFNEQFKPEIIQEYNDPFRVDWIQKPTEDEYFVGEKALHLSDPQKLGYVVRWPIKGPNFNTRDYNSTQAILSDIELILRTTLKGKLNIDPHDYKTYSVVLVIPDFNERAYVRDLVNMLLVIMGFKQICVQQESLAATYGAGISNACVVDIGAATTSIACVDEGMVIADTRMSLNIGGDDITEFLYVMLNRINFPYRDLNLSRSYDWSVMEDLKARLCTLAEGDVALNLYDFVVRAPGRPAEKYGLRAYDEIILAPMCIFEPRVIEFDNKRIGLRPSSSPDVSEEILEHTSDQVTQAMMISTQHLMPAPPPPQLSTPNEPAGSPSKTAVPSQPRAGDIPSKQEQQETQLMAIDDSTSTPPVTADAPGPVDAPMDIVNIEDASAASSHQQTPSISAQNNHATASSSTYAGGYTIDVCFEASKLPLDVAIFNSARAAGGDDKIRKYLQAVLVIGGTALIPGMGHALESRLQAIATPLVPNMEKVQIIPPPKEVDPRVLAWKGAAVLGKMDGVADLWITASDWDILGMRGLKERCFYL